MVKSYCYGTKFRLCKGGLVTPITTSFGATLYDSRNSSELGLDRTIAVSLNFLELYIVKLPWALSFLAGVEFPSFFSCESATSYVSSRLSLSLR